VPGRAGPAAQRRGSEGRPGPPQDERDLAKGTPQGDFWEKCYAPKTLREICRIRNFLLAQCSTRVEVALRGVMLGILHGPRNKGKPTYLSNAMLEHLQRASANRFLPLPELSSQRQVGEQVRVSWSSDFSARLPRRARNHTT